MAVDAEHVKRWRMILGASVQDQLAQTCPDMQLSTEQSEMDQALAAIYDETSETSQGSRGAGLGSSSPKLAKWLGDIRTYFKQDVVAVIQQDAIERKGLRALLLEPEMLKTVQPNVQLVGTLMSLSSQIPENAKESARMVVRAVVEEIKLLLEQKIRQAVMGALNRRVHSPIPSAVNIDWKWTISRNLKNYQPGLNTIVPERVYFHSRSQKTNHWTVIVDMDQSGSMADSVVYGAVTGSIFASLPALKTHVVAFDTEVVDLTEKCGNDPVDMIFGVQLGGGTDINKSVAYCQQFIQEPTRTIFILITDLFEGGNESHLLKRLTEMVGNGVRCLCLLALNDAGSPCFDEALAKKLAKIGIPCFACTPRLLPKMVEGTLKGMDLHVLADQIRNEAKSG